jgi:hypothetical protein
MAKRIEHVSGRVKVRDPSQLDSDRFLYITLDQAEANFGRPDSDGAVVTSLVDGTRVLTDELTLGGLAFKPGSLDSADSASLYALFVKGDPFDGTLDSVAVKKLSEAFFEEDTLDTVTARGNTTTNAIDVGRVIADSAFISGRLIVGGDLQVNGTTTTINSTELSINDKNIVLADSALSAAAADSAGITVAGANAQIYYKAASDTWNIKKATVFDSTVEINNTLTLNNVERRQTTLVLYLDEITGEVVAGDPSGDSAEGAIASKQIQVVNVNDSNEYHPLFVRDYVGIDSINTDIQFTYNPGLDRISVGRLELNQLDSQEGVTRFLVLNDSDQVRFRNLGGLSLLDSETDTLQTVTRRGDSTDQPITVKKLTTVDSASIGGDLQFQGALRDEQGFRLVIYDSAGLVLWG